MRFLTVVAFLGVGASLLVHLATFFERDLSQPLPWVWALHVGVFVLWFPMVFMASAEQRRHAWWKVFSPPILLRVLIVLALLVYNAVTFDSISSTKFEGVALGRIDGRPALHNHGEVVRSLTEKEYRHLHVYELRGFSSMWLLFYTAPALYFSYPRR